MQSLISRARIFRADFNAGHSIFADDSAPQRVVEVDDQNLGRASAERHDKTHPFARHMKKMARCNGQPRRQPLALVVPMLAAMTRNQRVVVENIHAAEPLRNAPQFTIDLPDESGLARLGLVVEDTETWRRRAFERMNDQRRLAVFSKRADPLLIAAHHALGGLLRGFRRQIGEITPELGRGLIGAHRQHDCVRRKAVERTLAVEHVLHVGIEIADMDFQIDAVGESFRSQQRYDGLDCERAQNRQFKFCKSEFFAQLVAQFVDSRSYEARRARCGIAPPKFGQPPRGTIERALSDQAVNICAQV